jgi:uncharacterized membrane protein (DUF106 family)
MTAFTQIVVWLNGLANACALLLLAPIAVLPGWLSATLVAAVTGVLMLLAFKYTSNQDAVKRVRNDIKANVLALSLFRESVIVGLRSQGRILIGAGRLLLLAVVPMLVMFVPMGLLLGQLSVWYQARPLRVGEEAVVTIHLADVPVGDLPEVQLAPCAAIKSTIGPVRVPQKQIVCWNVRACEAGYHRLTIEAGGRTFHKELAIGNGFMRVSPQRPGWCWTDAVLHPSETPFAVDSAIQAIDIEYPERRSWVAGSNCWLLYWFTASMVFSFLLRPLLKVNL